MSYLTELFVSKCLMSLCNLPPVRQMEAWSSGGQMWMTQVVIGAVRGLHSTDITVTTSQVMHHVHSYSFTYTCTFLCNKMFHLKHGKEKFSIHQLKVTIQLKNLPTPTNYSSCCPWFSLIPKKIIHGPWWIFFYICRRLLGLNWKGVILILLNLKLVSITQYISH